MYLSKPANSYKDPLALFHLEELPRRKVKEISCPNCAGQGHITDPVLQSSVVEACCPVCQCTGKVEPKARILNRFCQPEYENGELKGWTCGGTFVPSEEVSVEEKPLLKIKTAPAVSTT